MADDTAPRFKVSPRVLGPLGLEQLQDPALAILELVKNAWDADATRVLVSVDDGRGGRIAVLDNGHGMDRGEFETRWLVIGSSYKRDQKVSENGRPLIGEKGLGRLASFALGDSVSISSARETGQGFVALINWRELSAANSLEDYRVEVRDARIKRGTHIEIRDLTNDWQESHTEFLVTHAEFLASVPGERFRIALSVGGKRKVMEHPVATIGRLAEAAMEVSVTKGGIPRIVSCTVNGVDESHIVFRDLAERYHDHRLDGTRILLQFFRRDEAARRLGGTLERNQINAVLERYAGIRIYRDGINVPPYGLNGDDWAGLEKQRTATGGPTLVPGNSQLIGEVRLNRAAHPHLVVTAGRAGFSDQGSVRALAQYVRWAVKELGTARRAEHLGIADATVSVPGRIDSPGKGETGDPVKRAKEALEKVAKTESIRRDPVLRQSFQQAVATVTSALDHSEQSQRLYAQLASTGIAATSFAHELRAEFDVISEALSELSKGRRKPDKELVALLNESWDRVRSFAALFAVIPAKIRRHRRKLSAAEVAKAANLILKLAPPDAVVTDAIVPDMVVSLVPAELDSILLNLVSNAVKAIAESRQRTSGKIRVEYLNRRGDLELRVADNGSGIGFKVQAVMFEPLEGRFAEGTGMGLPIVKFIAERYRGSVVVGTPPKGFVTEIRVVLRGVVQ